MTWQKKSELIQQRGSPHIHGLFWIKMHLSMVEIVMKILLSW